MRVAIPILIALALLVPALQGGALPACTTVQHDYYKTTAPDGVRDATWHPQVDLRQGCVFDHEHGSNPALLWPTAINSVTTTGHWPAFGYTARVHGLDEGHKGYKVYVWERDGLRWMLTQHQGTSQPHVAACARYHTFDLIAIDAATGEKQLDFHLAGDFGASKDNVTGIPLTPPSCPDQAAHAHGSNGARQLPVATSGSVGYEPWPIHRDVNNELGFDSGSMTPNTKNPGAGCADGFCATSVPRAAPYGPERGTWRELSYTAGFGVTGVVSGTIALAGVAQYIKPGFSYRAPSNVTCKSVDPHAYAYQCGAGAYDAAPFLLNPLVTGAN